MSNLRIIFAALTLFFLVPFASQANDLKAYEQQLEGIDAVQAMALANQWKTTQDQIMSHVTAKEVVFEFPGGKIKKIPLPEDQMVVAIAPYLTYTHG